MKHILFAAAVAAFLPTLPLGAAAQTAQDLSSINDLISRLPTAQVTALGKARAAYNASLPTTATPLPTDADYWFLVFARANQSYVVQYP